MARVDHTLIYQVCRLIDGANTHAINTCLYWYEKATNATMRARYEKTLRGFVAASRQLSARKAEADFLFKRSKELQDASDVLAEKIDRLGFRGPAGKYGSDPR